MTKLEKFAASLKSPASFEYHVGKDLLVNGKDIYHEINTAIGDFENGKWEDFGINVGEAASKAIIGQEQASEATKRFATVLQGVIKAFGGSFNLEALLACIGAEDKAALILDGAV